MIFTAAHSPDGSQRCQSRRSAPPLPEKAHNNSHLFILESSPALPAVTSLNPAQVLGDVALPTADVQGQRERPKDRELFVKQNFL